MINRGFLWLFSAVFLGSVGEMVFSGDDVCGGGLGGDERGEVAGIVELRGVDGVRDVDVVELRLLHLLQLLHVLLLYLILLFESFCLSFFTFFLFLLANFELC